VKKTLYLFLGLILASGLVLAVFSSRSSAVPKPAGAPNQVYFPGDIVHIVVEAPVDTSQIVATMPDGTEFLMFYEQRTRVWHNYWEVPAGFKKGTYAAHLVATDVEGRIFSGETAAFFVGEPNLPVVLRLMSTEEASPAPPAAEIKPEPVPPAAEKKPEPKKRIETGGKPAAKPDQVIVGRPKDRDIERLQLMNSAREYMAKQDYRSAREELRAYLRIDPDNIEVELMLNRLEVIIETNRGKP
jgi:hypothetical protein